MATKDLADIVTAISSVISTPEHMTYRVTEASLQKMETPEESMAIELLNQMAPYVAHRVREDQILDNPRAAKFSTLSNIAYSYSKARLFDHSEVFETLTDEIVS